MYERFIKVVNGIQVHYAWVELPEGLLSSVVPRSMLAHLHGEDTNEETGEKTISRYRTELVDIEVEGEDEDGNPYTYIIQKKQKVRQDITNVTLGDFVLHHRPSKNVGKVIATIGACLGDRYRVKAVNDIDLFVFEEYLLPKAFGSDKWLDKVEMMELLPVEELE